MRGRAVLVALPLATLAACSPKDEPRLEQFRATCNGLVAGSVTAAEADAAFGFPATGSTGCGNLPSVPGTDVCQSDQNPVCELDWYFRPTDAGNCGGGCCVCRTHVRPVGGVVVAESPVCASRVVSGQRCCFAGGIWVPC